MHYAEGYLGNIIVVITFAVSYPVHHVHHMHRKWTLKK